MAEFHVKECVRFGVFRVFEGIVAIILHALVCACPASSDASWLAASLADAVA